MVLLPVFLAPWWLFSAFFLYILCSMPYMSLFLLSADAPFWNVLLIALCFESVADSRVILIVPHWSLP